MKIYLTIIKQINRDSNCVPQLLSKGMSRRSSEPLRGYSASISQIYCLIIKKYVVNNNKIE